MRRTLLVAAIVGLVATGCQSKQLQKAAGGPSGPAEPPSVPTAPPSGIVRQHVTGIAPAAGTCHVQHLEGQDLPDATCTPGAIDPTVTQDNIATTICVKGYTT